MAAYRIDCLDPAVTPRRVAVLLSRLPSWARGGGDPWSPEADLLALLIDHVAALIWITQRAHGAKHVRKPSPLPRPWRTQDPAGPPPPPRAGPGPPPRPGQGRVVGRCGRDAGRGAGDEGRPWRLTATAAWKSG
jgi:hypothetical protein